MLLYYSGVLGPSFVTLWGFGIGFILQSITLGMGLFWAKKHQERENLTIIENNNRELRNRDQIIRDFTSPKIVGEIAAGLDPRKFQSRWADLAIVSSDMRNFTPLIESATIQEIDEVLNTYFCEVIDSTFDGDGEINKLIGDAVLCVFEDPVACLNATVDMRKRLNAINSARIKTGHKLMRFGTGISYARVVSMNVGKVGKKLDRTVIGDDVNISARIESLSKVLKTDVLVTQKFHEQIPNYPYQRPLGSFYLKGKSVPTVVYELFGHHPERVIEHKLSTGPALSKILEMTVAGHHQEPILVLDELISKCPNHVWRDNESMDASLQAIKEQILAKRDSIQKNSFLNSVEVNEG